MTRSAGADLLAVARSCYGWLLACAPRRMIRLGTPQPAGSGAVTLTRVLGARHLLQGLVTATAPSAGLSPDAVLAAGAAVDAVHAGSMIVVAVACRPLRRAALADAVLEASLGAFGIITARRPQSWDLPSQAGLPRDAGCGDRGRARLRPFSWPASGNRQA